MTSLLLVALAVTASHAPIVVALVVVLGASGLGATTLTTGLGVTGPAVLGAAVTAAALVPVAVLAARPARADTPTRRRMDPVRELAGVS